MLESMWGLRLQPGYDPELTCMCHLWEVRGAFFGGGGG